MKYAVETLFIHVWENCWHNGNGRPTLFKTRKAAEKAITKHLADCIEAVEESFMEDSPDRSEFRVVEVP